MRFFLSFMIMMGAFVAQPSLAQKSDAAEHPVHDLGEREQGKTYPLKLTAQNENCKGLHDFRFDLSATPWIVLEGDAVVRDLAPGQSKSLSAQLDFTNTPPGNYEGQVRTICETCGFIPLLKNCRADDQIVVLRVTVVAPANQGANQNANQAADNNANPSAQQAEVAPDAANVETSPQVELQPATFAAPDVPDVDPKVREDLKPGQIRAIDRARDKLVKANAAAAAAVAALNAQKKKCQDCWDEVARLEAEAKAKQDAADQAQADADQAQADADAAEQAAKDAEQHSKDFDKELKDAAKKMNRTYKTLQMQAAARTYAGRDFGAGSEQYAFADEQVDKANDAAVEAQREYTALKATKDARKAAADKARAEADAKQQAADDAQDAADDAQEAADDAKKAAEKKRKECESLDNACQKAQDAADAAAAGAAAAAQAAQDKVDKANAQAAENLRAELEGKRKAHIDCIEKLKKIARRNIKLLQALRNIGAVNGESVPPADVDVEETVALWVASSVADSVAAAASVPTFQVFTILDGLQAIYEIFRLKMIMLTPGTAGYRGDDYLEKHLLEKGIADNPAEAKELVKQINKFMENKKKNPDYLKEEWEYEVARCKKLAEEIKALEAKLAATGK